MGATYALSLDVLPMETQRELRQELTMQAKTAFGKPPPPFEAFFVADGAMHVPRFYGLHRFGPAEHDDRVVGAPASPALTFTGTLTHVQSQAHDLHARYFCAGGDGGAMCCLPCGMSKTVFAIREACAFGRRFVLVHKAVLRDQWRESFQRFCPGVRVGPCKAARGTWTTRRATSSSAWS